MKDEAERKTIDYLKGNSIPIFILQEQAKAYLAGLNEANLCTEALYSYLREEDVE